MFTAVAQKDLADAEKYFDEHLQQNDYYAAGEIRPGQWIGVGAERLGLKQHVSREEFHALCENRNPQTDEQLTRRQNTKDQRRVFFDFTCSAPKSVSVLAVTLDDQRLVTAHEESARLALRELETFAATRVRRGARQKNRTTGNLVAAAFILRLGAGAACFDVGELRTLSIAAGDRLLLQANAGHKRFINGELVEVQAVQGDSILLTDGRWLPASYRRFTHGYAVTSHAAQGKTVDEVLVVASSRSLPAVHRQQFYVSISRGRERCQVFTDDVERLRSHVAHSSERLAAIAVVPRICRQDFIRRILQRGHRFLKHFCQRIAPTHSPGRSSKRIGDILYEHQHPSRRSIHV